MLITNLLLIPLGAVLWYLGGYGYGDDGIPDEGLPNLAKGWRRYVLPLCHGINLLLNSVTLSAAFVSTAFMVTANSMGYGEKKNWAERALVAGLLGMPAMFVYWSWVWPMVTFLTFIPLYMISLRYGWMTWHVVEAATGAAQSACMLAALMLR